MAEVYGLQANDLPDDVIPLEAVVVIKALDEDGEVTWFPRQTDSLTAMEAVGMLEVAVAAHKQDIVTRRATDE